MSKVIAQIQRFVSDQSGATMIEYGLIAALLSVAVITAMSGVGVNLQGLFGSTETGLATAMDNATELQED